MKFNKKLTSSKKAKQFISCKVSFIPFSPIGVSSNN